MKKKQQSLKRMSYLNTRSSQAAPKKIITDYIHMKRALNYDGGKPNIIIVYKAQP